MLRHLLVVTSPLAHDAIRAYKVFMKKLLPLLFALVAACDFGGTPDAGEPDVVEPECTEIGPCDGFDDADGQVVCNTDINECVLAACTNAFCDSHIPDALCLEGEKPGGQCCDPTMVRCCDFDDEDCLQGTNL